MTIRHLLGLYPDAERAANGADALRQAGVPQSSIEVLTDTPYPEGAFGEPPAQHRLFVFPFIGAACGFAVGLLLTAGTQLAYPMPTGGKPILSVPAMIIIMYEGTMLGAIIMTVLGIIFESRLPRARLGTYDPRISEGYVGVLVVDEDPVVGRAEQVFRQSGAEVIREREPED
ncbi:MAG: DUF3341 domain-containing protein [Chloroflexi bacterium]|nr:DUF3341 domain-containing protein [Chloroflexota bacterium]